MLLSFLDQQYLEAGVDEAGRGCFAGPVYAAAVILPKDFYHPLLNDSKQLNEKTRDLLRLVIEKEAISFAVASVSNKDIDRINILQASIKAMHIALKNLQTIPEQILVDGNRFKPYKKIKHQCIVQGDCIYASIAAASILAKTYRDEYMTQLHKKYTHYNWASNKGYGTPDHRRAMALHGLCKFHRLNWGAAKSETVLEQQ